MKNSLFVLCIFIAHCLIGQEGNTIVTNEGSNLENVPPVQNAPNSEPVVVGEEENPLPSDEIEEEGDDEGEEEKEESMSDQIAKKVVSIMEAERVKKELLIGTLSVYDYKKVPVELTFEDTDKESVNNKGRHILNKRLTYESIYRQISEVRIEIEHGYIKDIKLYTTLSHPKIDAEVEVVFSNRFPQSITNGNTKFWDRSYLVCENPNFKRYRIKLSDLLNFISVNSAVYPQNVIHFFKADDASTHKLELKRDWGIGTNIEGSLYTGADNVSESFGIIQTDLTLKTNLVSRNINHRWPIVIGNHAKVRFNSNKFDSQYDTLVGDLSKENINLTEIIARSYRQLSFDISFIHYDNMFHFDLNVGYQLNSTRVDDPSDNFGGKSINTHSFYLEPKWEIPIVSKYLSVELIPRLIQIGSLNNLPGDRIKGKSVGVFNPEAILNYYPSDDRTNGIHFRWILFDNIGYSEDDLMYWQIGYTISFNEVVKHAFNKKK